MPSITNRLPRIGLALLAVIILAFTLPAYANPLSNPGLASLSGDPATLGSVAGAFLGRQLTLALIAVYGVIKGTKEPMLIGAFAIAAFNLHDAVMIFAFGAAGAGAIAGLVLGVIAIAIMAAVLRQDRAA
jgi:hypothetical protein